MAKIRVYELAKSLNMEIVAEGVENIKQLNWLQEIGCRSCQGYYFGEPKPVEKIEAEYRDGLPLNKKNIS